MSRRPLGIVVLAIVSIAAGAASATAQGPLGGPAALVVDGDAAYVIDSGRRGIRRLDLKTRRLTAVETSEPLRAPFDIDIAPDRALVVQDAGRVVRISLADGRLTELDGGPDGTAAPALADIGTQVAADPRGGVFVVRGAQITHLGVDGRRRAVAGAGAGLTSVADAIADGGGHLFVSTTDAFAAGQRIRRIDAASGVVTTVVGPGTPVVDAAGKPAARVTAPDRLAWDRQGRLVFTDATRILRLDARDGRVRVVSERRASLGGWAGLAVTGDGDLIVSDYAANRIRRIESTSGRMTTLAGRGRPTPIVLHGESPYVPPDRETCSNEPGDAVLEVEVRDSQAVAVPGAVVRLFSTGLDAAVDSTGRDAKALSDASGVARIRLPRSGEYVVLANLDGFLPSTHGVRLSTGCTARVSLRLSVAPPTK